MVDNNSYQDTHIYDSEYVCVGLILFVKATEKDNTLSETWYHHDP